ncbi:unnamed protein product [Acanthoscelides obtectus]|uniref:Uncharacterized protein n=1 Tax=Acanthoscelides obtectus TaxID=200917 RepID=A0A9P0KPA8_ACAOB|nr:unnamed protein product [Acanthoscelides obtectus]CAK1664999.1 hypothetical protein AOBTE_LOCUS24601 [Acanthoscelides obtectus]
MHLCLLTILQTVVSPMTSVKITNTSISLSGCLLEIGQRYFKEQNSVMFSLPKNLTVGAENVYEIVIQELMTMDKWSFVIKNTGKDYNDVFQNLAFERISNFIFFVRDVERDVVSREYSLNSQGYYVIVLITAADAWKNINTIVKLMWEQHLTNGVILLPSQNSSQTFDIYTWYPFTSEYCAEPPKRIEMLDTCSYGIFTKNKTILDNHLPTSLNNCTIKAGYTNVPPYVINMKNRSLHYKDYPHAKYGIEVNLLNLLAKKFQFSVSYFKAYDSGEIYMNGTAAGNLLSLKRGNIDVALGCYVVTAPRSFYFDATDSFYQDDLVWCLPRYPIVTNNLDNLSVDGTSLLAIFGMTVLLTCITWIFGIQASRKYGIFKAIFQVYCSLIGVPFMYQIRHPSLRFVLINSVVFGFYVSIILQTFLIFKLANFAYEEKYQTLEDVYRYNLTTYFQPNIIRYFEGVDYEMVKDKWIECQDYKNCLKNVTIRRNAAICGTHTIIKHIAGKTVSKDHEPLLHCMDKITSLPMNMLFKRGFSITEPINLLITRIHSVGLLSKWVKEAKLGVKPRVMPNITLRIENDPILRYHQLLPVFKCFVMSLVVSVLIFLGELILHKMTTHQEFYIE